MKPILLLLGLMALFGGAIFLSILVGAVLGHFTHPTLGFVAIFPFAAAGIFGVGFMLRRFDGAS